MITILTGDAIEQLRTLQDESVQCCVTSPPYWGLRDYSTSGQLGLEKTPEEYVSKMVEVFREVRRVLRKDGTLWLNLGDSYGGPAGNTRGEGAGGGKERGEAMFGDAIGRNKGGKPKDLVGIPWRVAFALQADGWWLRSDIIWAKPNPMPESVTDRPTKAHEYLFLLTKSASYFYDAEAIKERAETVEDRPFGVIRDREWGYDSKEAELRGRKPHPKYSGSNGTSWNGHSGNMKADGTPICNGSRNKRSVWTVATAPYPEAHFATYPPDLIKPCIMAGTSAKGCCDRCGAPWERVVKREVVSVSDSPRYSGVSLRNDSEDGRTERSSKTLGWQPTCTHPQFETNCKEHWLKSAAIPCTVLDPFAGSGTTGAVALELGRKAVLIELNAKYVELIRQRCDVTIGLALA